MDKRVKITESLFIAIKSLITAGASYAEIKRYYGVSTHVCTWIKQAENYEEYKQITAAVHAKQVEKRKAKATAAPVTAPVTEAPVKEPEKVTEEPVKQIVEHRQSVTIQATHFMMQELQKTNELLTGISAKLAYIVEQLS